jgi:hypothetical protein
VSTDAGPKGAKAAKTANEDRQLLNLAAFVAPSNLRIFFMKGAKGLALPAEGRQMQRAGGLRRPSLASLVAGAMTISRRTRQRRLK